MKRRVFYVVNLDKSRILALGIFAVGAIVLSFSTGYRFGNTSEAASVQDPSSRNLQDMEEPLSFDDPAERTGEFDLNSVDAEDSRPEESQRKKERISSNDLALKATEPRQKPVEDKKNSVTFSDIARQSDRNDSAAEERKREKPATKPAPVKREKNAEPAKQKPAKTEPRPAVKKEKPQTAEVKKSEKPARIYTLQLGAFSSRNAANRMAEQIRKEGLQPYVVTSGKLHLVRLGRSESKQGLTAQEKKLRAANFRPITVTVGP